MYCKTDVLPKYLVVVTFALPYMQPCRCSKMDLVEQNMNCCQMSFYCINFLGLDILQGITKNVVFAVLKRLYLQADNFHKVRNGRQKGWRQLCRSIKHKAGRHMHL